MALQVQAWLELVRSIVADRLHREDGEYAMEWAVIAGIALAAAIGAFTLGAPTIGTIIDGGFAAITAAIP
jgi:hypothetical protein